MATNFNDIATRLWHAVDMLRANTYLRFSEYLVLVLGLIFLKYTDQKFAAVDRILQTRKQSDKYQMLTPAHYKAEGAIYLDERARFRYLLGLDMGIGHAIDQAMRLIERDNVESLHDALPVGSYGTVDDRTLHALLATFDSISQDVEYDLFGKIYEYFLDRIALKEGKQGGEFFTPTSIVKLIVEILEPYHGLVLDPACGSGGMFVKSAQFVQRHRGNPSEEVSIYGQEQTRETVRLCKMNLAVHDLSGNIRAANSYYEDPYNSTGKFDFVMANPPFNANGVDKRRLFDLLQRFPFGLPHRNNANYLWIQLIYSALKATGRAGFVMPNSVGNARFSEQEIRCRIIQDRVVDAMIAVNSNFFYGFSLPCTLWFFDKGKRQGERGDKVLFIDARHIYHQIDRTHRGFTSEQIEFLANIVRLYRNEPIETMSVSASLMQQHFKGCYVDIPGLCRVAALAEIEAQDWTLDPGCYVSVLGSNSQVSIIDNTLTIPLPKLPERKRNTVFICYSGADKKRVERLPIHLAPLAKRNDVEIWDETKIVAGEIWREEIKEAIARAQIAILLVSADFIASEFIDEDILPPLLKAAQKEGTAIIPVILSPCSFEDTQLNDFKPVNTMPLSRMNWHKKETLWLEVKKRVQAIMGL